MRYLSIVLFVICLFSCGKDADNYKNNFGQEIVNGFVVNWDRQTTQSQRNAIIRILNDMIFVEGGMFIMGATPEQDATGMARSNEYPVHYVVLNDYYIAKHEYDKMYYRNTDSLDDYRSIFYNLYDDGISSSSWYYYYVILRNLRLLTGLNFDFPTEAQWEFAARGGKYSKGYIYPGSNLYEDVCGGKKDVSTPNLSNVPNELGIYNMGDGYSEWCKDYYANYNLESSILFDPIVSSGEYHVVRGGNYEQTKDFSKIKEKYLDDLWTSKNHLPYDEKAGCRTTCRSSAGTLGDTPDVVVRATLRFVINAPKP